MAETETVYCEAGTPATIARAGQLTGALVTVKAGAGVLAVQLNKIDLFRYFFTAAADYMFWFPMQRTVAPGDVVSVDNSPAGAALNFQLSVADSAE